MTLVLNGRAQTSELNPFNLCQLPSGIRAPRSARSAPEKVDPSRNPRTARNVADKGEPYGTEAAEFATRRYMQRDVEIEVDAIDKSGGFIGTLYLNKTENAAITLVKEGLATVHQFSAESLSWAPQLYDAEVSLPNI